MANEPPPALPTARIKGIQSIEIGFRLIRALVEAGEGLKLRQLADSGAMSPSKARMYLVSLIRTGLVEQDEATGLYAPGPYAAELGRAARQHSDLMSAAQPVMDDLTRRTGARVLMSVWGHGGATLVRQTEGAEPLPIDFRIGSRVSLTRTATGHVFLAFLPGDQIVECRRAELAENRRIADLTFLDRAYLDDVATRVRAAGSATVENIRLGSGVVLVGYTAVAVPVFGPAGVLRLVLTVLHPKRRPKIALAPTRLLLIEAADRLSGQDRTRATKPG